MKKLVIFGLSLMALASASADIIAYRVKMTLKVPRVYKNTTSQGYRKIQTQKIVGYVVVDKNDLESGEPQIKAYGFVNNTHKVGGLKVTYADTAAMDVMWRYIGNNRTGVFRNTNVRFFLDLNPSYNIGEDEPDNTLLITLAGRGLSEKHIKGNVTGQLGCGCYAYGHVSPTRTVEGKVSDITPLSGTFTMKRTPQSMVVLR
jgi:hypothetical protein